MEKILEYTVSETDNGLTIKAVLSRRMGLSRHEISRLKFMYDGILLNGCPVRVTQKVIPHDVIRLRFSDPSDAVPGKSGFIPDILYEDEDLLAVNKPAGIPSHPSKGHVSDDLGSLLKGYYKEPLVIRTAGRLDKDVSGIMIYAKNQPASARLSKQREEGILRKTYCAFAEGTPEPLSGTLVYGLQDTEGSPKRIFIPNGNNCITDYETIRTAELFSVVHVQIRTGRTHQIRAGFAGTGHPLLGDVLYGGSTDLIHRPALHCFRVQLKQPFAGNDICIEAPLPDDMKAIEKAGLEPCGQIQSE